MPFGVNPCTEYMKFLKMNFSDTSDPVCKIGHIVLHMVYSRTLAETCRWVQETWGFTSLHSHISSVKQKFHKHKKNSKNRFEKLTDFFSQPYVVLYPPRAPKAPPPASTFLPSPPLELEVPSSQTPALISSPNSDHTYSAIASTPPPPTPCSSTSFSCRLPKSTISSMLRSGDWTVTPRKQAWMKKQKSSEATLRKIKTRHKLKYAELRAEAKFAKFAPKEKSMLTLKLKRKEAKIRALKEKLVGCRIESKKELRRKIGIERKEIKRVMKKTEVEKINQLNQVIKQKDSEIRDLEKDTFCIKEDIKESLSLKERYEKLEARIGKNLNGNKSYSTSVRLLCYDFIINEVSTTTIPLLIERISLRIGLNLHPVPSRSTIEQMTRELGPICELQAAETLLENEDCTIGFDATIKNDIHINCLHLCTPSTAQVIALDPLEGGTPEDYAKHINTAVDTLATDYSEVFNVDYDETRQALIANISTLSNRMSMSDHATVNHATAEKLKNQWGKSLIESTFKVGQVFKSVEYIMETFSDTLATAPNSTMHFLSSKFRAVKNKVVKDYLDKMEEDKREKIISWAKTTAAKRQRLNKLVQALEEEAEPM